MPITPTTITRHELNGLPVRVVAAAHPGYVGIKGRVVGESMRTLRITVNGVKTVPKPGATFEFALPNGESVVVAGRRLVGRPARRTETAGGTQWHSD